MDRNSVIGLLVIGAIVIGFSILNKPSEEEMERMKYVKDSIAQAQKERENVEKIVEEKEVEENIITKEETAPDSTLLLKKAAEMGSFGKNIFGENEFYVLENDLLKLTLSKKGGRPYAVKLKNYQTHDSLPLSLFSGDSTIFSIKFPTQQNRVVNTQDLFFDLVSDEKVVYAKDNDKSIALRIQIEEGKYLEYVYTISPNDYMIDFRMNMNGMDNIIGRNVTALDLAWEIYAPQQEKGKTNENNYSTIFFKHYQDDVDNLPMRTKKELLTEDISTQVKWVAFKDQFFSSVIIAKESFTDASLKSVKLPEEDKFLKVFSANVGIPYEGGNKAVDMSFYFGPNHFKTLKKYDDLGLQNLVSLGKHIIRFINRVVIIELFNFLQKYIGNYGLIILILTVVIKMALLPLTYKSYISQAKMRVLKPQIDEINAKIPKEKAMDRQKATMELYKKVGVNPMGGCLPMLLQMPILLAMFRFFPTSIELRQESFLWAHDLSTYDSIFSWSREIPILSGIYGNHISLFTLLMTISTIFSMKMNSQATSGANAQMPGMKGMMYMMPIMFMFMLNSWSSGLTYYYFLANMITFGQNLFFKRLVDEEAILQKLHAKKAKSPKKKSGFQARLEKMAKERGLNMPKK